MQSETNYSHSPSSRLHQHHQAEQLKQAKRLALTTVVGGIFLWIAGFSIAALHLRRAEFLFAELTRGEKICFLGGSAFVLLGLPSYAILGCLEALRRPSRDQLLLASVNGTHQRHLASSEEPSSSQGREESGELAEDEAWPCPGSLQHLCMHTVVKDRKLFEQALEDERIDEASQEALLRMASEEMHSADDLVTSLPAQTTTIDCALLGPTLTDAHVEELAERCGQLTSFRARFGAHLTDASLAALARQGESLQSIEITEASRVSSKQVCALLDSCPTLRRLILRGCTQVDSPVLAAAARHPSLQILDLRECGWMKSSAQVIQHLVFYHPTLRELRLPLLDGGMELLHCSPTYLDPAREPSRLRRLSMESNVAAYFKDSSPNGTVVPWNRLANLEELSIQEDLDPLHLPAILNNCRKLTYLSLSCSVLNSVIVSRPREGRLRMADPVELTRPHTRLRTLRLTKHTTIELGPPQPAALLAKLGSLEEVQLEMPVHLPAEALSQEQLPQMRSLSAPRILGLSKEKDLCEAFPHLQKLHVGAVHIEDKKGVGHREGRAPRRVSLTPDCHRSLLIPQRGARLEFFCETNLQRRLRRYGQATRGYARMLDRNRRARRTTLPAIECAVALPTGIFWAAEAELIASHWTEVRSLELWEGGPALDETALREALAHFGGRLQQLTYHIHDDHAVRLEQLHHALTQLPGLRRLAVIGASSYALDRLRAHHPHLVIQNEPFTAS